MIYKQLFLMIALAMVLGCASLTPYKPGSDPEVNVIKLKINQQEAIEIITNNVKVWWGYRNETEGKRRILFDYMNRISHPENLLKYSGYFTVTPFGVSFKIHGETHKQGAIQQAQIDADEQFEFSEVRQIIVDRSILHKWTITIYLKSDTPNWHMVADTKVDHKDIAGEKKLLAALEILCPNLLK
jgi:hypothetical protein